ncbi:MAG: DUF3369 domain-containing protein [Rhodospirillaceae bacterium]|nr:DUF3369 domain-containing protein [Rhodospirillaceae bacterium]MCA8934127.1 DUF3369 domain-containing protein [Rhodospirillaceae bacterium]
MNSEDAFDDDFLDDDEPVAAESQNGSQNWKVLVVDDEPDVHTVTRLALSGVSFRDRPIKFINAYSAEEGRKLLAEDPEIALILLDVVMETDHAGLDMARWVRQQLGNQQVRIVLRTGQPGLAPEREVIESYDINDYQAKSQLTQERLFTVLMGSLRNFSDIQTIETNRKVIEANRRGLLKIIDASSTIFRTQSIHAFAEGVLQQLSALIVPDQDAVYAHSGVAAFSRTTEPEIVAGIGTYAEVQGKTLDQALGEEQREWIREALANRHSVATPDHYVGFVDSGEGRSNVLLVEGTKGELAKSDQHLLELYCCNVGIAFDNLMLREEIERTQREIIYQLGEVVETRSKETGNHVRRVAEYSYVLALAAGKTEEEAEILRLASPLHDIGKVGIPDAILLKPGRFTPEEREVMNTHAQIGYEMLKSADSRALKAGAIVAHQHHEKWDGSGYPRGLKGEEIHLYGRITALADVFDALGSARVYKPAWELPRIMDLLKEERGRHFDPHLIDLFFEHFEQIDAIRHAHSDV